ncbi:hypothetical protein [Streptomyces sp. NPDC014744]|uniref:hypothetical protein n=1 Tax=Streptomyces sp. NPDC014744 TaxID=3364903 RepID=UPI0036FE5758
MPAPAQLLQQRVHRASRDPGRLVVLGGPRGVRQRPGSRAEPHVVVERRVLRGDDHLPRDGHRHLSGLDQRPHQTQSAQVLLVVLMSTRSC